ncbi:MAG TPA: TraR/DksA C4-type zinc finger protein [Candidatus Moranbacteria bacterium]|nr:TraR/DksA C4-type zinc finger protein [Candidatus Moranbacteria bacterium]
MPLKPTELQELENALLERKKIIEEELSKIAKPTSDKGDYETSFTDIGTDEDDNASEVEEYAGNLAVENSLEKQLHEANEALERLKKGTYGKCVNCGKEISLERLRAYPAASTCTTC